MSAELAMRRLLIMTNFKRKLMAVGMAFIVSAGAFAQRKGEEKRPPKPDTKVVVEPKREKPPQNNNRGGDKRNDGKKGRG
jgi:hypothetical protein